MQSFDIQIDNTVYTISGALEIRDIDNLGAKADLNTLLLSFNNQVIDNAIYLIHPDEVKDLPKFLSATKSGNKVKLRFKVITSDRDIKLV